MAKAKGRGKRGAGSGNVTELTPERRAEYVVKAFLKWMLEHPIDAPDAEEIVEMLLMFHRVSFGEPNPGLWHPNDLEHAVVALYPGKVRADASVLAQVPRVATAFAEFLALRDERWTPGLLRSFARDMLDAEKMLASAVYRDSTKSFGARIVDYAVEQGVDVTDPEELAAFMQEFNELPQEERVRITDGISVGGPAVPGAGAHERPDAGGGLRLAEADLAIAEEALGFPARLEPPSETLGAELRELANGLTALPLLVGLLRLRAWAGAGPRGRRAVTATGAIKVADLEEACGVLGIAMPERQWPGQQLRMDSIRELAKAWDLLLDARLVVRATSTSVQPAANPSVDDLTAAVEAGRDRLDDDEVAAANWLVGGFFVMQLGQLATRSDLADIYADYVIQAYMLLGLGESLHAPSFDQVYGTSGERIQLMAALLASSVTRRLEELAAMGIVTIDPGSRRVTAVPAARMALVNFATRMSAHADEDGTSRG